MDSAVLWLFRHTKSRALEPPVSILFLSERACLPLQARAVVSKIPSSPPFLISPMPTITAIAWDRLLDRNSSPSPGKASPPELPAAVAPPPTYSISPALYAATDTSSIPDSTPSPYIINHKRRDLRAADVQDEGGEEGQTVVVDGGVDDCENLEVEGEEGDEEEVDDDFFDPRESMSVASSSETEDGGSLRMLRTPHSIQSEFYDASADFSDGSVSHSSSTFNKNNELELRALRLNLLEEIEKRKRVEEALINMQDQWQRIAKSLHQVGFSCPEIQHSEDIQQIDPTALCQEIVASKFVMEAVERGIARAETETVLEEVVETKNHEISRLRDRLQYYEAMNREMSQRNQEVVETARQQRLRRRKMQRWIWSGLGLTITFGVGLLAYSYLTPSSSDPSPNSASVKTDSGGSEALLTE